MKQRMSLWMMSLLFGILPMTGADVTSDPSHLVFGKMWMEGGCRAQLAQRLYVEVTNTGDTDYYGVWKAIDENTGYEYGIVSTHAQCIVWEVQVAAGETKSILIEFLFEQEGHYQALFTCPEQEEPLFRYEVDIAPYADPGLKGSLRVDMLERTENGNILHNVIPSNMAEYQVVLTGTATLTNEGEFPVFSYGRWANTTTSMYVKADPDLENGIFHFMAANVQNLPYEIKSGETITFDFNFKLYGYLSDYMKEGREFYIEIGIMDRTIVRETFTLQESINTYWTADGHVKPLPLTTDGLKIPAEALAVELRGQYLTNKTYSVDLSEANPNCLYYLDFLDNVPQGFPSEANIIRGGEAKTIVVDADYDYYCPMPFKAREAMFTYTPVSEVMGPANTYMSQIMSAAFILPFDAQKGWLNFINDTRGTRAGFFNEDLGVYCYNDETSKLTNEMTFSPVADLSLMAYTPYLMYVKPSPVTFYAEDIMVPATREAAITTDNCMLTASTKRETKAEDAYLWSCDRYYFYNSDNVSQVRPFNVTLNLPLESQIWIQELGDVNVVYISRSDILPVPGEQGPPGVDGDNDHTDIKTLCSKKAQTNEGSRLPVFSLSGQRVATLEAIDGCPFLEGLKPGVYIINGKKVVVR